MPEPEIWVSDLHVHGQQMHSACARPHFAGRLMMGCRCQIQFARPKEV